MDVRKDVSILVWGMMTDKDIEILGLIQSGIYPDEIARITRTSPSAIKKRLRRLRRLMGITDIGGCAIGLVRMVNYLLIPPSHPLSIYQRGK